MQWIGLTGPMGGGKTSVGAILRRLGYATLDADQIVHQLLSPGGQAEGKVIQTFGQNVCDAGGKIDRRLLGQLVFGQPQKLEQLEKILHPLVRQEAAYERTRLAAQGCKVAFYDVPLLFEKKMEQTFDHIVVVTAPDEMRRRRLKDRSQMTDLDFIERSKHHISPIEKEARASVVIHNLGDLRDLEDEVKRALRELRIPLPSPA